MTRHVWWVEVRRHVGTGLFVVWIAIGIALLFTHREWAGELASLTVEQRIDVIVLGPIAVALAVWAGGRERRRGLTEIVATTPRSTWQRHVVQWSALTASLSAGLLLTTLVGAWFVLGHTTYWGGRWWLVLAITCSGLGALAALGLAIGTVVSWRVAAPVAGLATYIGLGVPGYAADVGPQFLLPNGYDSLFLGLRPALWPGVITVVFFSLFTLAVLAAVSRGMRPALPIALAAVAVGLIAGSHPLEWWWRLDPQGAAPVCSAGEPRVCVMRTHAHLLPAVTRTVRPALIGMGDAAPPEGAREVPISSSDTGAGRFVPFTLYGQAPLRGTRLLNARQLQSDAAASPALQCPIPDSATNDYYTVNTALELGWRALVLNAPASDISAPTIEGGMGTGVGDLRDNLLAAAPPDQQSFLTAYAAAGRGCDRPAIEALYLKWTT